MYAWNGMEEAGPGGHGGGVLWERNVKGHLGGC